LKFKPSLNTSVAAIALRRIEGKYEILHKIRDGGMGAIYKVRHRLLDEVRAIKVMHPQLVDDPEFVARFLREARMAVKLRHPNIAELHDFTIDEDKTAFIVMDFIEGATIEDLLKVSGPPSLGLALEIGEQTLKALAYLHSKGYVHRDISPDNLMLAESADGQPQVKLIDLGIAKDIRGPVSHLTRTGSFLGKLRYACPEQFGAATAPTADPRGDLYSFGVVLYELLTGVYPIAGNDTSSLIAGHLLQPPMPFEESDRQGRVPPALRATLQRTLAKHPEGRPASAQELADQLTSFRRPRDLHPQEWKSVLARSAAASSPPPARRGSTQRRLDEHFGPGATPARSSQPEERKGHRPPAGSMPEHPGAPERRDPATRMAETEPSLARQIAPGERRDSVPEAIAAISAKLSAGDLPRAAKQLEQVSLQPGTDSAFRALERQLQQARQAAHQQKLGALLDRVRELVAQQSWQKARRQLRRAESMAPGNVEVSELKEHIAALSRHRTEQRRQEARRERNALQTRRRVDATLERARQLWANGDLQQALEAVRQAEEIDGLSSGVQALAGELQMAAANQDRERRRAAKLAEAAGAIQIHLARNELNEASKLLDLAVVRFGPAPPLRELWERLEQLRKRASGGGAPLRSAASRPAAGGEALAALERLQEPAGGGAGAPEAPAVPAEAPGDALQAALQQQAEELLQDARLLLLVEDFADAARKLARALKLMPGDTRAQALLERANAALHRVSGRPDAS
jgi:serine/threonine protein kinase